MERRVEALERLVNDIKVTITEPERMMKALMPAIQDCVVESIQSTNLVKSHITSPLEQRIVQLEGQYVIANADQVRAVVESIGDLNDKLDQNKRQVVDMQQQVRQLQEQVAISDDNFTSFMGQIKGLFYSSNSLFLMHCARLRQLCILPILQLQFLLLFMQVQVHTALNLLLQMKSSMKVKRGIITH